jgi:hypothetical protein
MQGRSSKASIVHNIPIFVNSLHGWLLRNLGRLTAGLDVAAVLVCRLLAAGYNPAEFRVLCTAATPDMSTRGIPKKNARLFRITHGAIGLVFGGIAAWLLATSRLPVVAGIFAVAAFVALTDALVGWRSGRE